MATDPSPGDSPPPSKSSRVQALDAITALLKATAWPLVVVVALIWLHTPIHMAASALAVKIKNATKFEAGPQGLKLEVEKSAGRFGAPDLAGLVQGLSANALRYLLALPSGWQNPIRRYGKGSSQRFYFLLSAQDVDALRELQQKALVVSDTPVDNWIALWNRTFELANRREPTDGYVPRAGANQTTMTSGASPLLAGQFRLSERGERAKQVLVEAVAAEFAAAKSSESRVSK